MAPLPRMRHWSCPDDLLLESPAAALPLAPTRSCSWEAEDLVSLAVTSLAPQRPSRWEERVLEMRERRIERRRRRLTLVAAAAAANLKLRPGTNTDDDKASDDDDNNNNIEDITEGVYRLTSVKSFFKTFLPVSKLFIFWLLNDLPGCSFLC